MSRILVVDDEYRIRELIKKYAVFEGHEVIEATDGLEAISICTRNQFDLIIMDVMMPELDGFSACREIRKRSSTPIIMLSARGEEYDKLFGFELGIDDYVVKPFSPKELMARVKAVLNRNQTGTQQSENLTYKGLVVDNVSKTVTIDGAPVVFTRTEYDLLCLFLQHRGEVFSRQQLLDEVWPKDVIVTERTVDVNITRLRKKLGAYAACIVT